MAGVEYARVRAWGHERATEYERVSPCMYMDFPQSLMEPVLLRFATGRGWSVRFDTCLRGFVEESGDVGGEGREGGKRIVATVVDGLTGLEYKIRTKFLFGADGGRSLVAKQLGLPFSKMPLILPHWTTLCANGV